MYVSVDLGGTNTRVASSRDLEEIYNVEKFSTKRDIAEQRDILSKAILRVANNQVSKVILGVPGSFDLGTKKFLEFSNYHELDGVPFGDLFTGDLKYTPLLVANDADLAGLGEAVVGIGKNYDSVAYITISTGIGGVYIKDKKISSLAEHHEPGHFVVDPESKAVDGLGIKGSFEAIASGAAFEELYGIAPEVCEDDDTWRQYGYYLGEGLLYVIHKWWPDVVILGGGVSNKFLQFFPGIMERFARETNYEIPPVLKSELMDEAGLWGGFVYLKDQET